MRRIVYSKDAIKFLITLTEPETTLIIDDLKKYLVDAKSVDAKRIPGAKVGHILLKSLQYYVIFYLTKFKGQDVLYVVHVFPKEELHYYIDQ